jgi:tetratricopeptide (TPR) repeat protein
VNKDAIIPILQAGFGAHQDGALDIASENYRHVLDLDPDNADALHLLGLVRLQQRDAAEAVALIQRSLEVDPENPQAFDHLGTALLEDGKPRDSIAAFERALEMAPNFAECWFNLGNAYETAQQMPNALNAYKKAIALDPNYAPAHANLGSVYVDLRVFSDAVVTLEKALTLDPELGPAWISRGNALRALGQPENAISSYERAMAIDGEDPAVHCLIADCHHDMEQHDKALPHYRRAVEIDPDCADAFIGASFCEIQHGDLTAAETSLDAALAVSPGNRRAMAYKTIALDLAGRHDEARKLTDIKRDLKVTALPVPEGYVDLATFNRDLAQATRTNDRLTTDTENKSTRGGADLVLMFKDVLGRTGSQDAPNYDTLDTGAIAGRANADPIVSFFGSLRPLVDSYLKKLESRACHPHFAEIPSHYQITSWATILDTGGRQLPHIHPSAWMSGVYYVELPENVSAEDDEQEGWIIFGGSGYGLPECDVRLMKIPPAEGQLIFFPGYFFHRTIPFHSSGQRISIAFDVIPID